MIRQESFKDSNFGISCSSDDESIILMSAIEILRRELVHGVRVADEKDLMQ
jgi:hypothetical protein